MPLERGRIVRSKAGRDKDGFLVVVGFEGNMVCLCDGKERPLEKPKRKNQKHISDTNTVLNEEQLRTNKSIKRALNDIGVRKDSQKGDI